MVDGVTDREPGRWTTGYKHLTQSDWFLVREGSEAYLPGTIALEGIAQMASFLYPRPMDDLGFLLASLGSARFGYRARAGERLDLRFELLRRKTGFWIGHGEARVDGALVASARDIAIFVGAYRGTAEG